MFDILSVHAVITCVSSSELAIRKDETTIHAHNA